MNVYSFEDLRFLDRALHAPDGKRGFYYKSSQKKQRKMRRRGGKRGGKA